LIPIAAAAAMRFSSSRTMRWTSKLVSAMLSHSSWFLAHGHLNKRPQGEWFRKKRLQIAIRGGGRQSMLNVPKSEQ
jgi:hypothetical protein